MTIPTQIFIASILLLYTWLVLTRVRSSLRAERMARERRLALNASLLNRRTP
jgi:hypothetical protein